MSSQLMDEHVPELLQGANVHRPQKKCQDLELTLRSQAGDIEAFGALVIKYHPKIFTVVRSIVCNEHDAWDVVQEGFLIAWRSIHRFQGRSTFYTWLYSITINVTINSLRRKGQRKEVELNDEIALRLPSSSVNYRCSGIGECIDTALAKLSPADRAVVLLRDVEGLHYNEIADILDLPVGTVMSRLFNARRNLRRLLRPLLTN